MSQMCQIKKKNPTDPLRYNPNYDVDNTTILVFYRVLRLLTHMH